MGKLDTVWPIISQKGTPIHRNEEKIIPLPEKGELLAFRNSEIDLYFVKEGQEGPRHFLLKLNEGLLVHLKPIPGFTVFAVAHTEGEIFLLKESILDEPPVEQWVEPLKLSIFTLTSISDDLSEEKKKECRDRIALFDENRLKEALDRFSERYAHRLETFMNETEQKEETLLKERDLQSKTLFEYSLSEMEGVLSHAYDTDQNPSKDPLFYIFQKIGKALRSSFSLPERFPPKANLEQKIQSICEFSQIRWRKITLQDHWRHRDMGPLLVAIDEKPYALISGKYFHRYKIIGIDRNEWLDEKTASQISTTAYMFYPPFSSHLKTGKEVLKFLGQHTWPQWQLLFIFSVLGMLNALFPSIATYYLFKYGIPENSISLVSYLTLGLLFFSFSIPFFYFLRNYSLLKIEGIGAHAVQAAIWDRLLKLSPAFFRKFSIGNLFWRVMSIDELRVSFSNNNIVAVLNGLFAPFYLLMMFAFAPKLTLVTLFISLIALFLTFLCAYIKIGYYKKYVDLQGTIRGLGLQIVLGISKIRTAGAEKSAFANWASLFAKSKAWQMKAQLMQNTAVAIGTIVPYLSIWAIYASIIHLYGLQELPLPAFLAFNIAFGNFTTAVLPLGTALTEMVNAIPNWERTQVILEEPLEETEQKMPVGPLEGHIRIDNVIFSYHPDTPLVLRGVSIEARPREFIALVGKSGSGKSTIARLLLGFEKPVSGSVYFDGKDFEKLDPRSVRKQIGSVLQGDRISGGSLYQNLVCGANYSKEEIRRALKISGFDKDLDSFPMGLNTYIPAGGETLSGGQKQRILLARAFLSNPPILLLDEATSALDNQTQEEVSGYIEQLHVTRIVVAQRLKTIRNADRIYVIDNGLVAASGTFNELVAGKGLFAEMVARQKL